MSQRPVTLTDIVAGHVSLDIEGFDRIYLNGYVPALQTGGQVAGFLHWRGFPIASPAALGKISQGFRSAVRRYADSNDIPWVLFRKGDRKLDPVPDRDAGNPCGMTPLLAWRPDRGTAPLAAVPCRPSIPAAATRTRSPPPRPASMG
jgi:hypothetical protein